MSLRIVVAGSTGWVGRELVKAIVAAANLELVGAIARDAAGQDAGEAIGEPRCGVPITRSFDPELAATADVLIDYTRADTARLHCDTALGANCAVVIGSSGLMEDDFRTIDAAARAAGVGVIASGNFSITAMLLKRFALEAARYVADIELIDYAAPGKPDAPSGTTVELADALAAMRREGTTRPVSELSGRPDTRGGALGAPRPVQVHAVRLPSYVLAVEAVFGGDSERLTLRHDAGTSAKPYVAGTLLAARRVRERTGLTRGIETLF